ncbi:MAG: hypothetical protein NT010_08110 [Proteobacteria bacterium]|nr:hypothetical protein [Pseudomonadota bacterium]
MRQIIEESGNIRFCGAVEDDEDILAASEIAAKCPAYSIDDDDEDYCDGARTCFNCRYRRWLADGFECMKGLLLFHR